MRRLTRWTFGGFLGLLAGICTLLVLAIVVFMLGIMVRNLSGRNTDRMIAYGVLSHIPPVVLGAAVGGAFGGGSFAGNDQRRRSGTARLGKLVAHGVSVLWAPVVMGMLLYEEQDISIPTAGLWIVLWIIVTMIGAGECVEVAGKVVDRLLPGVVPDRVSENDQTP